MTTAAAPGHRTDGHLARTHGVFMWFSSPYNIQRTSIYIARGAMRSRTTIAGVLLFSVYVVKECWLMCVVLWWHVYGGGVVCSVYCIPCIAPSEDVWRWSARAGQDHSASDLPPHTHHGTCYRLELQTKAIRRFTKISQSQRRSLLRAFPG